MTRGRGLSHLRKRRCYPNRQNTLLRSHVFAAGAFIRMVTPGDAVHGHFRLSPVSSSFTLGRMSLHSYSQCWLHFIWATLKREPMITDALAPKLSAYLTKYAATKDIFMKCNFVNPEHVHALINLPTNQTIETVANLLKGASSRWIGQQKLLEGHFYWGRGYGVFSVSQSDLPRVCNYIANQEEHHRKRNFLR